MYSPTERSPGRCPATERWWGDHLRETRWQLELSRLLVDPVFRGRGVPRGDGRPVVLMPGFGGGDQTLLVLAAWLRRIGYRPQLCGFVANVGCSDRALERVERRVEMLHDHHGRRVALIGHSRGGHYARALGHRRPDLVSHAISVGAGLRQMLATSYPTQRAAAAARGVMLRSGRARSPRCLTDACDCRVRSRLRRRVPDRPGAPDEHLLEGRRRRPLAGRARPVRRLRRGDRQPRRADLQPQDLPRDRDRARRTRAGRSNQNWRTPMRNRPADLFEDLGHALSTDYFFLREQLTERAARGAAPRAAVRRRRGAAGDRRLLGARRDAVAADPPARRAGDRRRGHPGLRLPRPRPDRARARPHGAQPRRRQPRDAPRRAGRPGDEVDRDARLRGAEAALAAGDGTAREARRVRADRARPRLRLGRARDERAPRRRQLRAQRRQALDRATGASPTSSSCGRATRTAGSTASWSRRARPATTPR